MKKQQGAALIVVMSLLAISLMIGLMSMQSSQLDERLAGNYKAAAEAQMHAEEAASSLYNIIGEKTLWVNFEDEELGEDFAWDDFKKTFDEKTFDEDHCERVEHDHGEGIACYVEISDDYARDLGLPGDGGYIIAMGAVDGAMAESEPIFIGLVSGLPQSVEDVLNSLGSKFYNVLTSYNFSSSQNIAARSWESDIFLNQDIFSDADAVVGFRDDLLEMVGGGGAFLLGSGEEGWDAASGGIAVVYEDGFSVPNNIDFEGVMVVFGNDFTVTGGGNASLRGAILHVPFECGGSGCEYVEPNIDILGGQVSYEWSPAQEVINSFDGGGIEFWR